MDHASKMERRRGRRDGPVPAGDDVQAVEGLLESLIGGLARVDGAAEGPGSIGGRCRDDSAHALPFPDPRLWFRLFPRVSPKKAKPFHWLPVTCRAGESNNRFTPVHRHIAEFLGARHLAGVINRGLPARRVLALITGEDESVVTELRGLSAWLAAQCKNARADLIERDPTGVGLYGDSRGFSLDEKRALLRALKLGASRLDCVWRTAAAFGASKTSRA